LYNERKYLSQYAETKRIYLKGGQLYKEGELFRQPELAATFARLQRLGPNECYEGETARLIVADMKRNSGLNKLEASSSDRYHLMAEAMRRAFADRAEYMGDTDFVKVPIAGLIDKSYAT